MKNVLKYSTRVAAGALVALILATALFTFAPRSPLSVWAQQTTGYRFSGNALIFSGPGGGLLGEPSYNAGPDTGFMRMGPGQIGQVNGNINSGDAVVSPPPVVALSAATTGGFIPAATYRAVLIYVTPTLGLTNVAAAGEATQAVGGTGAGTLTATAPIAAAGAAGYIVAVSPAGGATLTETLQPMSTAVCAGAFTITSTYSSSGTGQFTGTAGNPPAPATIPGLTVCPFGVNAVMTSLVTGPTIPLQNSAVFPAAVPELICNLLPQTANTTITTIQTMGSCVLAPSIQNVSGKVIRVTGHLIYTSAAQTGTMTISVTEGGITPIAVTSAAITTGGQTNAQAEWDYYLSTSLTGASGTLEAHGHLCPQLATAANGTAIPCYNDTNTAASSAINLTAANTLAIAITMSSSTTSAQLRDAEIWLLN